MEDNNETNVAESDDSLSVQQTNTPKEQETVESEQSNQESPAQTNPEQPPQQSIPVDTKVKPRKKPLIIIGIIVAALALFGGGVAAALLIFDKDSDEPVVVIEQEEIPKPDLTTPDENPPLNSEYAYSIFSQQSGETWYTKRQEIPTPAFAAEFAIYDDTKYYAVGTHGDKTIYMKAEFGLGEDYILFEADSAESTEATAILNFDNRYNPADGRPVLDDYKNITIDTTTIYDSLTFPSESFTLDNGFEVSVSGYGVNILDSGFDWSTSTEEFIAEASEIQTTKNGVFYETVSTLDYQDPPILLESISFLYLTPIQTTMYLNYEPFSDMTVNSFTFTRGSIAEQDKSENNTYAPITRGCGFGQYYTRYPKLTDTDVTQIGADSSGAAVYGLVDTDYKILTKYVDEFQTFTSKTTNKQELLDNNALIFVKNIRGEWEIYGSPYYTQFGGCAKPVVYLYPTETTQVNVAVGADVKVSDPLYPSGGWQNVLAEPNGALTYNGIQYDSLFWEGPGIGEYPEISSGTIVRTENALQTIRDQMAYMGFNNKEISDFIDYWHDKLPAKPYTRLSWLQNKQMHALAPLVISPKPDTMLRAFLDFEGLQEPYDLAPQTLQQIERKGFTVTEWGGLTPFMIY